MPCCKEALSLKPQDSDLPDGHEALLREARFLLRIYDAGSEAPKVRKRQSARTRRRASATKRSEVEAEIFAKISKAKAASGEDASNGGERKPRTRPIMGEISNNKITVTSEPWVHRDEQSRQYESLRNNWLWRQTPSERRMELLRFVIGFYEGYYDKKRNITGLTPGSSWPGWRRIMEQWNERYPQDHGWHYKDVRNFRRDFRETFETVTRYQTY
jgi:hypothetical protein